MDNCALVVPEKDTFGIVAFLFVFFYRKSFVFLLMPVKSRRNLVDLQQLALAKKTFYSYDSRASNCGKE